VPEFAVGTDHPAHPDVQALLEVHLAFAHSQSPPDDVHALDVDALLAANVAFFSIRVNDDLLGVGALKQLDPSHAEIKSMHTAAAARGRGVARVMLDHLVETAVARGCSRVSLETGPMAAFAPARALYASAGFKVCEPFGEYTPSPYSVFMERHLA
jgi:putative acetyltransferase